MNRLSSRMKKKRSSQYRISSKESPIKPAVFLHQFRNHSRRSKIKSSSLITLINQERTALISVPSLDTFSIFIAFLSPFQKKSLKVKKELQSWQLLYMMFRFAAPCGNVGNQLQRKAV